MTYLTVSEAARTLRVSDITIRRWIWAGKLPATRLGRVLRIRRADLESVGRDAAHRDSHALRPGSPRALLLAVRECAGLVRAEELDELDLLIAQACERPAESGAAIG